ncbi:MAG: GtrA family protein [Patescibacteria group bacterium]|nr:GtrA family protein [Patescibacteria group bacterium]MDE1966808.1 GtrA family protein [Patescibacteria group bacterium]
MIKIIFEAYCKLDQRYSRHMKVLRFIIAGGTAAVVDLAALFLLTSVAHVWYLLSAVIAFILAFGVSFMLQKYWTFRDRSSDRIHSQAAIYFIVTGINLGLNTLFVWLFVEYADFNYMIAQIVTSALIAVESYFIYQRFVFKDREDIVG